MERKQQDHKGRIADSPASARLAPRLERYTNARYPSAASARCDNAHYTAGHERPREEWIEIPVPALVSEESFARAQELLQENKVRSKRRTITPSVVQRLVSCQKCGYARCGDY